MLVAAAKQGGHLGRGDPEQGGDLSAGHADSECFSSTRRPVVLIGGEESKECLADMALGLVFGYAMSDAHGGSFLLRYSGLGTATERIRRGRNSTRYQKPLPKP